jgi:ribosomal protein L17
MNKLFAELKDRYQGRAGGYSRITKLNYRAGDNNLRVIFSLVQDKIH